MYIHNLSVRVGKARRCDKFRDLVHCPITNALSLKAQQKRLLSLSVEMFRRLLVEQSRRTLTLIN